MVSVESDFATLELREWRCRMGIPRAVEFTLRMGVLALVLGRVVFHIHDRWWN